MENKILNDKNISIGRLVVTLLMLMIVVVGGTFAWLTYSSKQSALVLTIGDINDTQIKLSPYQVTGNITPGTTHTSGVYSEVEVTKGNNNSTSFALFYKINQLDTTLIDKGLSYTIVNTKGTTSTSDDVTVKTGKFSSLIDTSKSLPEEVIILDTNTDSTLSANTSTYYRVYLWVDSNVGNQTDIQNSKLDVELNGSIGSVAINGYSVYGHTLTTTVNDAVNDNNTTYSYQWYSNSSNTTKGGTAISGATSSSYTIGSGLVGKYVYVVVTTSDGKTLSDITDASNNYTIEQECSNYNDGRVEKTTPVLVLNPASGTVEAGSDNTFTTTVSKSANYVGANYTGTQTAVSANTGNITIVSGASTSMTIGVSSSGSSTIKYHGVESVEAQSNITVTFTPADTNNVCTVSKNYSGDKQDTKAPTGLSITTTDDLNSATQTATLRCSDIVGVTGYYFGTTKPTASSTFKTVTSTKSMSVTETVSAAGTYYLACKDAAGNTSVSTEVKQVYYSYSVNQMLVNVTGTEGTYTTAHYTKYATIPSSGKYIVPSGTTMVRDTIKGSAPTGSSTSLYKGLSGSAASSSAATLLTSDPKISANTTYSSWWNRTTYTITVATGGNGSNKVSNQRSQSVTASSSGTDQTLSIRYGEQITATATPNTGYTFSGWSGLATGTTNPLTNTPNKNATLTANFTANGYTVTYYNGTSKINTSSHVYDAAKNLTTWATLGATVTNSSSGWEFAGWSTANNNTTRTYTDGQSVNNLTATVNGNVNLYAVYKRTVTFKSGVSAGNTDSTVTQYWNPAGTTNGTHLTSVSSPAVTTTNLTTYGWSALGYRNDATAGAKEYDASGTIYPATNGSNTLYGVYSRTVTFKSGVNAGTSDGTRTQYLNASGNTVSSIKSYAPSTTNLTDYGWSAIGYRDDTTAGAKEYSSGTSTSIKPAYNTSNTLYAAYSRTVTFKSGVSAGTTDGTRTQYLNASGNTVSNINSYTPTTTNLSTYGWSALGYRDDTTAGDKEYASGTSTAITPVYNTSNTLYGVYSRTVTFKSGVNKATTDGTRTQYLNTSGNAVTNVNSYVPVDVTNWTTLGYRDDTTSGAKEYSTGTSTSLTPVYNVSNTLYAVYSRSYTATFYSGVAKATTKTVTSSTVYYNSNTTSLPTTVSITTETPADVSGFSKLGWRDDKTAGAKEHSSATSVTVAWGTNFYAVYSRTITAYSGVSKATNSPLTQYYNSDGAITSVTLPTPTAITNWTTLGYRDDTTAGDKEYASTYTYTPAVGTTPVTFYAVYSRTLTISYNGNGSTGGSTSNTTKTIYLSSNSTTTSSQEVTLAANGFTKTGYTFSKWAAGSASGTQYSASGKYTPSVAYNASTFGTTMYAIWTANTYKISYSLNGGTAGSKAPQSATYDSVVEISNPTKSGFTFKGWTFNGNTSTALYGTSSSAVTTAWSDTSTKVTATYFKNLTPTKDATVTMTANWEKTVTGTFYYYDGSKIASTTSSCTIYNSSTTCTLSVPSAVSSSTGQYGNAYVNVATSASSITAGSLTVSSNTTYYAFYRSNVTVYYPSSTSAATSATWYRNSFFTSTSAMSTVLSSSNTGTSNGTVSQVTDYSFAGFATSVNSRTVAYSTVDAAATSTSTTLYSISTMSVTGTFYYNSNTTAGSLTVANKTASGTRTLYCSSTTAASIHNGNISVPSEVSSSVGKYNSAYKGVATGTASLTSATPTTANTSYYAFYSSQVTIYRPTSTSECSSVVYFRNEWFTSTTATSQTIASSQTSKTAITTVDSILGSFSGLATAVNNTSTSTVATAAASSTTTFYAVSTSSIEATFYYNNTTTAGSCSVTFKKASGTRTNYCSSTTAATTKAGSISVPSEVSESKGKFRSAYKGVHTAASSMSSTSPSTANTTYYANYSSPVTIYYSTSSAVSQSMTRYRNEFLTSTSECGVPVIATSNTGTTNYSTAEGKGGADWYGLTLLDYLTSTPYLSVSAAAKSANTTLYTNYQMSVTYSKGANVSAIGSTSGTCIQTNSESSCDVTLPTITSNTGYTSVGWSTTNGATTGTAAGSSYTLSTDDQTLYANAKGNTYTITYYLGNASGTAGSTNIGTSTCTYGSSCTLTTWSNLGKTFPNSGNGWSFAGWGTSNSSTSVSYSDGESFTYNTTGNISLYSIGSREFKFYSGITGVAISDSAQTQYWNPHATTSISSITIPTARDVSGWTYVGYRATNDASSTTTFTTTGTNTPAYNSLTTFDFRTIYKRTLTISYNSNGGSGSTSNTTETQYFNSGIRKTGANVSTVSFTLAMNGFTKSGYRFAVWADGGTSGTQYSAGGSYSWAPGVSAAATKTMYAIWTANTYTVTLNNQGATTAGSTSVTATYDSAMPSITVPSKTGYTFGGYFSTTTARDLTSSIEKYASIIRVSVVGTSNGWKMTSDDKGSHVQAVITITDSSLSSAPRPEFNDVGLTNGTQYRVTGGSGTWTYYFDFDVTETMVSYRQYRYDTTHRFIDFDDTSSNTSTTVNMFVAFGKKYYNSNGTSAWNYDVAGNTTLYAKWTANTYPVSYDACGGTGQPNAQTKSYGTTLTLSSTKPTKSGYIFKGWSADASTGCNATSATYAAGGSYTSNASATMYAVWEVQYKDEWVTGKTGSVEVKYTSVKSWDPKVKITYSESYNAYQNKSIFSITNFELYTRDGISAVYVGGYKNESRGFFYTTSESSTKVQIQEMSVWRGNTVFKSRSSAGWTTLNEQPKDFPWSTGEISHNANGELTINLISDYIIQQLNSDYYANWANVSSSIVLTDLR